MNTDLAIVLAFLGATVIMFSINRPRSDAVGLIMMTLLPLTGVISLSDALSGLADPNVVLIAALFVIGESLVRTGVTQNLGNFLVKKAGQSETRLMVLLMVIVSGIGAFMSSTGVVAIFIPVALRVAFNVGIAPGRLMMPLSIAALISGMLTLVATPPNLVVNAELMRQGFQGFSFFAFTPFGLPILFCAVLYMLVARRWLVSSTNLPEEKVLRPNFSTWIKTYNLGSRNYRVSLTVASPWVGKRLSDLKLSTEFGIYVVAIRRRQFSTAVFSPQASTVLENADTLFLDIKNPELDMDTFCETFHLRIMPFPDDYLSDISHSIGMAEMIVPEGSRLVGKTVQESGFRGDFDLTVIGLKRGKTAVDAIQDVRFAVGDTVLVSGAWNAMRRIQQRSHNDLIVMNLPVELENEVPAHSLAPFSIAILALVVGLMVWGGIPNVQSALIGCLLLGLCRCIDMDSAYRSIHWQTLILIVGMLPFSLALQKTGGIELAAKALGTLDQAGPHVMLAALFLVTATLGLFISNTATAVLIAPLAMALSREMNVSPYPFCMTVALAASAAFMTPVSSPVNTLVASPGKYSFFDFVRIGVPLVAIVMVITLVLVPIIFPFYP
ncbi:SLC13 family permease [Desulfosarcina sp. OttesenSCG-928-B08]|nr:SLC13 family permease [Desulfosarcina sp. OttesenSCG-928-B08]